MDLLVDIPILLCYISISQLEDKMANLKSAKKSIRQTKKRNANNTAISSELKTLVKKLNSLIDTGKSDEASKALAVVMSKLDKAAKKGLIKKQNASRRKSRLSIKIAKIKKQA